MINKLLKHSARFLLPAAAPLVLLLAPAGAATAGPTAVWLGQDGHDYTNPSPTLQPNDVQDIHIQLQGLDPDRPIASILLTGYGGGEWHYNGPRGSWQAALFRQDHSATADLYFDAGDFDTNRRWDIRLFDPNGGATDIWVQGAKFDRDRRMPQAALQVKWIGQDGQDWTGPGPSVGPDGFQDVHLALSQLSAKVDIDSLTITTVSGQGDRKPNGKISGGQWEFGLNHKGYWNAELTRHPDDPSKADVFFSPAANLAGKTLGLRLIYAPGQGDSASVPAEPTNPRLRMPRPAPVRISRSPMTAVWLGQDGSSVTGRGDVHVALRGVPGKVTAAALSDTVGGFWVQHAGASFYAPPTTEEDPGALPLAIQPRSARDADLYFPPYRDEAGSPMTLRLRLENGTQVFTQLAGGACDPNLRGPAIASSSVTAHPGDDLSALANQYGAVQLSPGDYRLTHPLVLSHPVTLTGPRQAVVTFAQAAGDSPWQTAVKIESSSTTLNGFTIRFDGPVRWAPEDWVNGSAVLGMTAPQGDHHDPGININITNMNIESPPAAPGEPLQQEPRMMRLIYCTCGRITGNVLKGGVTDVMHGPWEIAHNDYQGTLPGTFDYSAFACHYTHDYHLHDNTVHAVGPSGKNWRFLVMTQSGADDTVRDNNARDIGPRDDDTIPNPNAPEMLLTEAYRLHFEGRPAAITSGGMVLQIPEVVGAPVHTGTVVSILTGRHAGEWVRIAQAINPTTYLMASPLPAGDYDISISTGFVGETYERNTIDTRGSSVTGNIILAGNHFGTRVLDNHLLGGGDGIQLQATPTERPNIWGWSHAPFLGGVVEGNVIEDPVRGAYMAVQYSKYIKSSAGRVYMDVTLDNNRILWSPEFVEQRRQKVAAMNPPQTWKPVGLQVGDEGVLDPSELALTQANNQVTAPAGSDTIGMKINGARVNGQVLVGQELP